MNLFFFFNWNQLGLTRNSKAYADVQHNSAGQQNLHKHLEVMLLYE